MQANLSKNEDHSNSVVVIFGDEKFCCFALAEYGCAQEEILVLIYPELLAGSLFITNICDNEAVSISGAI